jgi:hypothetical protein
MIELHDRTSMIAKVPEIHAPVAQSGWPRDPGFAPESTAKIRLR